MGEFYDVSFVGALTGLASDRASHFEGCHTDVFAYHVGVFDYLRSLSSSARVKFQHALDQFGSAVN